MAFLAWIILIVSALAIAVIVLAQLPKVLIRPSPRIRLMVATDSIFGYFWLKVKRFAAWLWHFVLEAKDIRPSSNLITSQVSKVKQVFKVRIKESEKDPDWMPEVSEHTIAPRTSTSVSKENKTAEDLYLETIRKDPNNRAAYEGLGRLYLQEKDYEEAVETFRYLTKIDPGRDVYWSNLGISLYSRKDYSGAIQSYEQALKINSKIPTRWINIALCFEALDEHTRAVKAINKALELDRRNVNYLMLLGDIYIKIGNKVRSEEVLTQVLSLDPTNRSAREKLMRLRI